MRAEFRAAILPVQLAAGAAATLMAWWSAMPWPGSVALGISAASGFLSTRTGPKAAARHAWAIWIQRGAWLTFILALALAPERRALCDAYMAVAAWLVAAAILAAALDPPPGAPARQACRLGFAWAQSGILIWLAAAYLNNQPDAFVLGLGFQVLVLVGLRLTCPPSAVGVQVANSLILFCVLLPAADLIVARTRREQPPPPRAPPPVFDRAGAARDPAAFERWWGFYMEQWKRMSTDLFMRDPEGALPIRLRPGARGSLLRSAIAINRRGFRGREISAEKGGAYRIVALGESTTFGCTLEASDQPWPELLEEMIRTRLRPARPVEVINAGVPSYTLEHNLLRLEDEILPLQPDLIVSYHGYNGFRLLKRGFPMEHRAPPPAFKPRPSRLLALTEYRLKRALYRNRAFWESYGAPPLLPGALETDYARAYLRLVDLTRARGVRLALGNFSMAVNPQSAPEAVAFYSRVFGDVMWQLRANVVHSFIVKQVAGHSPGVIFLDTHPGLDGHDALFIDLVHLTQAGRQQLAESIFAGLRELLERELPARRAADARSRAASGPRVARPAS